MRKMKALLCRFFSAALLAGLLILALGLYYQLLRAGIPYQNPTPEMQISYAVNFGVGQALIRLGLILAACGGVLRLLLGRISKK